MMLLNSQIRSLLPQMNRDSININNDNLNCEALEAYQKKNVKSKDTPIHPPVFITGATVAV